MPRRQKDAAEAEQLAVRIGKRVRKLRLRGGATQAELSERLGLSTEAYGRIERDTSLPSFPTFLRLCEVLPASPDLLLARDRPATHRISDTRALWSGMDSTHAARQILAELPELDAEALAVVRQLVRLLRARPAR